MDCLSVKESNRLLKRFKNDIRFYASGLREIKYNLEKREDIIKSFSNNIEELQRYVKVGEILNDINENFIGYESICDSLGTILEIRKVYEEKPNEMIINLEKKLYELKEGDFSDIEQVKAIEIALVEYRGKDIFNELNNIEKLLAYSEDISVMSIYRESINFKSKVEKFNSEDRLVKCSNLDMFFKDNIDGNIFVDKVIRLYQDYTGIEIIIEVNRFENMPLFSRWNRESLRAVIEDNIESYFRVINTLNMLEVLKDDLYDINSVEEQIMCISDLEKFLNE